MPPASPDSPVGRARGPVGAARRIRPVPSAGEPRSAPDAVSPSSAPPRAGAAETPETEQEKARRGALEALLVDLGSQVRRGPSREAAEPLQTLPTGIPDLDLRLGGGFPLGRLSEICGAPSSGRTSMALRLLSETLGRGLLAAWIDLADAFDPASAADCGIDLERLLWVRPLRVEDALRSSERLLRTEGFQLVVFDLSLPPAASPPARRSLRELSSPIRDVTWLRLARLAASTGTALVALSSLPSHSADPSGSPGRSPAASGAVESPSATGARADLVLEMQARGARFVGPPALLETLETTALLRRHRSRPIGARVPLSLSWAEDREEDWAEASKEASGEAAEGPSESSEALS
ncbi:MAG: P-loop NTPase family protein [bacterium]